MGTEILHPQDCLIDRLRVGPAAFSHRKSYAGNSNSNPKTVRKQVIRPEPKKRFPQTEPPSFSKKSTYASFDDSKSAKNFMMGQVTILKRGESLDAKRKNEFLLKKSSVYSSGDLIVYSTERLGPDPEMVPKQIRITDLKTVMSPVTAIRSDVYAGSAFSLSPSPSSLPLPTFSKKNEGPGFVDDSATKDLRRLLRLN